MKKALTLVAGTIIAMSSCTTVQHTASTEMVDTKIVDMTVANLNVSPELAQHTHSWKWNPFISGKVKAATNSATAELLIEHHADVVVEPQYIVNRRGIFRGGSVTVIGHPATYTNFRPMTSEDAELLAKSAPGVCRPTECNPPKGKPGFFKRMTDSVRHLFKK